MRYEVTFQTDVNLSEGELEDVLDRVNAERIPLFHYTIKELDEPCER